MSLARGVLLAAVFLSFALTLYVARTFASPSYAVSFIRALSSYAAVKLLNITGSLQEEWRNLARGTLDRLPAGIVKFAEEAGRIDEQSVEKVELRHSVHQLRAADQPFHPFEFLVEPTVCTETKSAQIVIFAAIGPHQAALRQALRDQWGNEAKALGIELVFSIGRVRNNATNKPLDVAVAAHENWLYGDILMANYEDSYKNLIVKYWTNLDYHVHRCSHVPFMAHIDSDTIIYAKNFATFLRKNAQDYVNHLGCQIYGGYRVKDVTHQWYISKDLWPDDKLPKYCHGIMILASYQSAKALISAVPKLGIFYFVSYTIWDVVTGPLAKTAEVGLRHLPGLYADYTKSVACDNATIAVHRVKKIADIVSMMNYRKACCTSAGRDLCS